MSNSKIEATLRWASAGAWMTFARQYHPLQTLPFFLGFVLVAGLVVMTASVSLLAKPEQRARVSVAVALISSFSALVFLNYVVQTTFVPLLVRGYSSSSAPVVAALTMSNPNSLGWCLEMWAYALAGVATWLIAVVFEQGKLEKAARLAFAANARRAWLPRSPRRSSPAGR